VSTTDFGMWDPLTSWIAHVDKLADGLRAAGHDPVVLRGGMGAKDRAAALARLRPQPGGPPLLAVATGPYAGEGCDCPPLDTLFLAAPVSYKGKLVQYAGRIMRPYDGKTTDDRTQSDAPGTEDDQWLPRAYRQGPQDRASSRLNAAPERCGRLEGQIIGQRDKVARPGERVGGERRLPEEPGAD
jgi:superfamily II DNA or RNA helicase